MCGYDEAKWSCIDNMWTLYPKPLSFQINVDLHQRPDLWSVGPTTDRNGRSWVGSETTKTWTPIMGPHLRTMYHDHKSQFLGTEVLHIYVNKYQSFDASSSNIKCSSCWCERCEHQYEYFLNHVKELTNTIKELWSNIGVLSSKKISQPLNYTRSKISICRSLSNIRKRKKPITTALLSCLTSKGKDKVITHVIQKQYPLKGFNISGESLT